MEIPTLSLLLPFGASPKFLYQLRFVPPCLETNEEEIVVLVEIERVFCTPELYPIFEDPELKISNFEQSVLFSLLLVSFVETVSQTEILQEDVLVENFEVEVVLQNLELEEIHIPL